MKNNYRNQDGCATCTNSVAMGGSEEPETLHCTKWQEVLSPSYLLKCRSRSLEDYQRRHREYNRSFTDTLIEPNGICDDWEKRKPHPVDDVAVPLENEEPF